MAELKETNMNFAALKRVDPYAKSLLETAAHVALYTFVENEWEKTDIEGALFVYSRTGEPFHNILIMNRLNMKNLVEPVTQGLDLQLQDPFLLYRNPQGLIYGIWFYDKEECVKIAATLSKIIKESCTNTPDKRSKSTIEPSGNNVDIFSMLTKAQEEYNSKSPRKSQTDIKGSSEVHYILRDADPTPQSVMDFFAKASNGSKIANEHIIQPPGMFMGSPRSGPPPGLTRMTSVPIAIPPPQSDVKPLLQRLMSNPAHSVEHIEKQQQAITPQNDFIGAIRSGNSVLSSTNSKDKRNNLNLGFNVNVNSSVSLNQNAPVVSTPGVIAQGQIESGLGFLRISDSPPDTVHSQQFFNSNLNQNRSPLIADGPLEMTVTEHIRPLSAPMDTQSKPALMPPVMFTSSIKMEEHSEVISTTTPTINVNPTTSTKSYQVQPEPLTKNQLLQAVNYLLKNDPDFMTKLHEAYVKSFAELVQ